MLLHRIALKNLLSFGPDGVEFELRPLNVFIGPNGSGKSNLIDAVSLLQAAPTSLASPVREGGGIGDWLWKGGREKGAKQVVARVEVIVENPWHRDHLRHVVSFVQSFQQFELTAERIERVAEATQNGNDHALYLFGAGQAEIRAKDVWHGLQRADLRFDESILSQRRDPEQYAEITYLGKQYADIRIYRDWSFGRQSPPRLPQRADQRNDFLNEDCSNLGLVLNRLRRDPAVKARLLDMLNHLYPGVDDFDVSIEGGTVQVFFQEGKFTVPATRLSDGTLRYLCLLAILCHPDPPPLICIEEPELGMHPDVMPAIADLLREASARTQLLVTTHSDVLVDDLSGSPEDVVVCQKEHSETTMRRLETAELTQWLEKYSLGELWISGQIGGKRW